MRALAWTVLALVFVDELLVMAAYGVWGWHVQGLVLAVVLPFVAMVVWWTFASPKAPQGGPVRRPLVKAVVFALAGVALWDAGHEAWAVALLVFSVVINAAALLRPVRLVMAELHELSA